MDEPYSNRELDEKFANLSALIREKHEDTMNKLSEVVAQTSKTNGNVANLKLWRAYTAGALAVILFLIASVGIPLLSAYLHILK